MGIIAAFVLLGGVAVGAAPGLLSIVIHILATKRGRGSWWLFFGLTLLGTAAMILAAVLTFQAMAGEAGQGPPTSEDFQGLVWAAGLLGAAPGLGAGLGILAVLKKRS